MQAPTQALSPAQAPPQALPPALLQMPPLLPPPARRDPAIPPQLKRPRTGTLRTQLDADWAAVREAGRAFAEAVHHASAPCDGAMEILRRPPMSMRITPAIVNMFAQTERYGGELAETLYALDVLFP